MAIIPAINDESKEIGIKTGKIMGNKICNRNSSVLVSSDGLKNPPYTSTLHGKKSVMKNEESNMEANKYLFSELKVISFLGLCCPSCILSKNRSATIAGSIFKI